MCSMRFDAFFCLKRKKEKLEPQEACANQFELMIRAVTTEEVQSSFARGSLSGVLAFL